MPALITAPASGGDRSSHSARQEDGDPPLVARRQVHQEPCERRLERYVPNFFLAQNANRRIRSTQALPATTGPCRQMSLIKRGTLRDEWGRRKQQREYLSSPRPFSTAASEGSTGQTMPGYISSAIANPKQAPARPSRPLPPKGDTTPGQRNHQKIGAALRKFSNHEPAGQSHGRHRRPEQRLFAHRKRSARETVQYKDQDAQRHNADRVSGNMGPPLG